MTEDDPNAEYFVDPKTGKRRKKKKPNFEVQEYNASGELVLTSEKIELELDS